MGKVYHITIPGPCVAKERARRAKNGYWYTPPRTQEYEAKVAAMALVAGLRGELEGPIRVEIVVGLGDNPETDVVITCLGENEELTQKGGDADNYAKSILDGLKPYFNDKQVVDLRVVKRK